MNAQIPRTPRVVEDAQAQVQAGHIPAYYTRKTHEILHKYGPGPRVHFHVGLFDRPHESTAEQEAVQRRIVASQEAVLERAARLWQTDGRPPAALLDVGCGLGGGCLYWAQRLGCPVTGLTITAEHIPVIEDLVRQAGAQHQVQAVLGDVHDLQDAARYDAAVAVESSGYMDRARLFAVVARALRPGGWFGIQEHFVRRPEWTAFIDAYYRTRLGTLDDYITAAQAAGFTLERDEDITDGVAEFWIQSQAWTAAELDRTRAGDPSPISPQRLTESALMHAKLFRLWREHALETRLLLFRL
ncbi:class I SAM-dependent methyltransferase [Streptomyces sp. NPDC045470]|uniref:class I SAM-dependent methyltransferase n=1 Tax=Streptomyces sp. NPDC045470 TaxID=3155469 RepID=UPI0033E3D62E